MLGTYPAHLAGDKAFKSYEDGGHEGPHVSHPVGWCANEHYAERERRHVLLKWEILVHRDQGVKPPSCAAQERAVLDALPAQTNDRSSLMAGECRREVHRHTFSSSRTRTRQERFASHLERGQGLLATDRWELAQKFVESLAALEIVEERMDGHAATDEDGCASKDLGIAVYHGVAGHHASALVYNSQYTPVPEVSA